MYYFNSRPSARGDDGERVRFAAWCYFNSRPSARGDKMTTLTRDEVWISIHAPPRGATCFPNSNIRFPGISIHAPPRGATGICGMFSIFTPFQFTPLREGRPTWI